MSAGTTPEGSSAPAPTTPRARYRFGFDIGGTFTDFVLVDGVSGAVRTYKTPTTPRDPARAVVEGWRTLVDAPDVGADAVELAVHGTTLITNALIERDGAVTGLVTTKGFRDVLEMRKEMRYDIYDLLITLPDPLVPRPLRLEVDERVAAGGTSSGRSTSRSSRRWRRRSRPRASRPLRSRFSTPIATPSTSGRGRLAAEAPARRRSLAFVGGRAGDPRVRADVDHSDERLRPATRGGVPALARRPTAGRGVRTEPLPHALQRRHHDTRNRQAVPCASRRVRPCRRRPGGGLLRPARRGR